jgi:hypothetical protein
MTKDEFRELLTRFLADSGILVTLDPRGLRNFDEMYAAADEFRDRLADKLYARYQGAIERDRFDPLKDGVGGLKPRREVAQ